MHSTAAPPAGQPAGRDTRDVLVAQIINLCQCIVLAVPEPACPGTDLFTGLEDLIEDGLIKRSTRVPGAFAAAVPLVALAERVLDNCRRLAEGGGR